jgi:uncharacterized protein
MLKYRKGIMMGVKVAIIKPTGDGCNLNCDYCYVDGKPLKVNFMSLDNAKMIVDELMDQNDVQEVLFLWHGGEPLLRGIDFFREIFNYQEERYSTKFKNAIQTNLTLLTDDWIAFFRDYDIVISTSLDGPKQLHDINRKYADGRGSYDLVVGKIKMAQNAGLKVNVLTVVSKTNMDNALEVFNELNLLEINHVGFLQCYSMVNDKLLFPSLESGDYAKFMISFFDLFLTHECSFKVREFDQLFSGIVNHSQDVCCHTGNCGNFICINSNGDVYACDTSPQSNQYRFGNITLTHLKEIFESEQRKKLINDLCNVHDDCVNCVYFGYCHNGCYNMRINGKYNYCEDRKLLYGYMLDLARNLINNKKKGDFYVN